MALKIYGTKTYNILGVYRSTPILAMNGDMGGQPSIHKHLINLIRLWNRLIEIDNRTPHPTPTHPTPTPPTPTHQKKKKKKKKKKTFTRTE